MSKQTTAKNQEGKTKENAFLDFSISRNFREVINSSPIFQNDSSIKGSWNLICAVMDRLDSSVQYLNDNTSEKPQSEEEFMIFLMFADMVYNAVRKLFDNLKIPYPYKDESNIDSKRYFSDVYISFFCENEYCMTGTSMRETYGCSFDGCRTDSCFLKQTGFVKDIPTDDNFFEYLRALAFAHPFETSKHKKFFAQKGSEHYSPWVIIGQRITETISGVKNMVGVRIYSNKFLDDIGILDLCFPFDLLKEYIKSRYDLLMVATEWAEQEIKKFEAAWSKRKVNRELTPIEMLKDIKSILLARYEEDSTYSIETAIEYLECPISLQENLTAIEIYRKALIATLPTLCDAIDAVDNDNYYSETFNDILHAHPKKEHQMAHYQREKIFGYLREGVGRDNITWGLTQSEYFANEYAKKYVTIKPRQMDFTEIKLLVTVAGYFEKKKQESKAK